MKLVSHKTSLYFVDPTQRGSDKLVPVATTDWEVVDPIAYRALGPNEQSAREDKSREEAARLATCWNACLGLDLPPDVPQGILADVVRLAVSLIAARGVSNLAAARLGTPEHAPGACSTAWKDENAVEDELVKALAKLGI